MAIWPFGRKGKRPRSQMKASDAADRRLSFETPRDISMSAERTPVARKPSRKRSKREKHRSAPVLRDQSSGTAPAAPGVAQAGAGGQTGSSFSYALDNHTSLSSIGQDHFTVSRAIPTLQKRDSAAGKGNTLKKRLSKRSARELQREREIKALSSSPPSGYPRLANTWGYQSSDVRRGTSAHSGNHADNRTSNQSLPLGSQSSSSDLSDLYTYKVNAFAVFAPRPIIRYSENPNKHLPPRSTNPSANSMRRDMFQGDEDDWQSHKRIAELADEMDAAALRELMERDRRRREKKALEEQERRKRRLQRRLDREQQQLQLQQQQQVEISKHLEAGAANEDLAIIDDEDHDLRGRDKTPSPATSSRPQQPESIVDKKYETGGDREDENAYPHDQSGSWLREPSNSSRQRYSDISAHVIGNIDDRSLHAGQADQVDRGTNATSDEDISKHRSPLFQAVGSSSSAHMSSIAQESISDLSRTGNSEKRFSDTSSRRMSSWISFFRRGSLRKRRSKEIDAPSSDFSNTSRDSFMKIHSHSTGPSMPVPIPERHYRRAGTVYRTQSKFVEHLDNYPISPPDSRMQSPVPVPLETVSDVPAGDDVESAGPSSRQSFTAGDDYNYTNDEGHSRPMSWDENSGALSQSLASIDSEGSWMSGNFLRRISQKNPNFTSWRNSNGMNKLDKYKVAEENEDEVTSDESLNQLADQPSDQGLDSITDIRRPSSSAIGLDMADGEGGSEDSARSSNEILDASGIETWHQGIERKPTVVRRDIDRGRKMSKEVVLGDIATLDTDAASMLDNDLESPLGPASPDTEINRATSIDYGRNHKHARQISAGSAKLLDIAPRSSVDSSRQ